MHRSMAAAALSSRVAVVTGANKGVGYCIAEQLLSSKQFGKVILACRNKALGKEAEAKLGPNSEFVPLDLDDDLSIAAFVDHMNTKVGRCDGLVNNAAIAFKGSDPTPFEGQTGPTMKVNYWATTRLTNQLLPLIKATGTKPFVVSVASMAGALKQIPDPELRGKFSDPHLTLKGLDALVAKFETDVASGVHREQGWGSSNYGFSKLAIVAYTKVLARLEEEESSAGAVAVKVNCCCPGYCDTDMSSHRGSRAPQEGARNAVMLALQEEECQELQGGFVKDFRVGVW